MAEGTKNRGKKVRTFVSRIEQEEEAKAEVAYKEEVLSINRVAKVVAGGRRFSFNALAVVGDESGNVGLGFGKANEVPEAIAKALKDARKRMFEVPLVGRTIPHPVIGREGASRVMLKPAAEGTGIIAGPGVRQILALAGVRDVLTKVMGSKKIINTAKATLQGLQSLIPPEHIANLRDKSLGMLWGGKRAEQYKEFLRTQGKVVREEMVEVSDNQTEEEIQRIEEEEAKKAEVKKQAEERQKERREHQRPAEGGGHSGEKA